MSEQKQVATPVPLRTMTVTGARHATVPLDVFAETEWLAVTRESGCNYVVTHKPTGMATGRDRFRKLEDAITRMNAIADIDWDWGQDWSPETRYSPEKMLADPKCAAARAAYKAIIAGL